jgi:hypothetical protein
MMLMLLAVACLPWPGKRGRGPFSPGKTVPVPVISEKRGRGRFFAGKKVPVPFFAKEASGPQPQWRVLLWLGMLIVLPVYGFYCHASIDFTGPVEWWRWLEDQHAQLKQLWWLWAAVGVIFLIRLAEPFSDQPIRSAIGESCCWILRSLLLVGVIAVIVGLCWAIDIAMTAQQRAAIEAGKGWQSLWVPRYLGFVWPALIVAIAALLMRLPTRPLRIAAIIFFLGINLAVGSIRLFDQTEPPVDFMAADYLTAADSTSRTLVRMDIDRGAQYPGGGNLFGGPGEYYLDLLGHVTTDPPGFQQSILRRQRFGFFPSRSMSSIPTGINRIIVWNQFNLPSMYGTNTPWRFRARDEIVARTPGWHLVDEQEFMARDCWIWEDLAMYRRRVYARD